MRRAAHNKASERIIQEKMDKDIDFDEFGLRPPTENSEDFIRKFISASLKIVSINASPNWIEGIEFLGQFISPQLEKSRSKWEFQVFCAINELFKRNDRILNRLYKDEEFQTLLRQSYFVALRTHKSEKFAALKAGLMNSALNENISFDKKEIYLRLVDELTVTHLLVLNFIYDFKSQILEVNSFEKFYNILSIGTIDKTVPKIDSRIELSTFRAIMKDLENKGLVLISSEFDDIKGVKNGGSTLDLGDEDSEDNELPFVSISTHGQKFLEFIKEPN